MGLAASQCRLLLLTARKSDLELRAQMITQRKIVLSAHTESVAKAYTQALQNRTMRWVVSTDGNAGTQKTVQLTYDSLTSQQSGNNYYRVSDSNGNLVFKNANDVSLAKTLSSKLSLVPIYNTANTDENGNVEQTTENLIGYRLANSTEAQNGKSSEGYPVLTKDVQVATYDEKGVIKAMAAGDIKYNGCNITTSDGQGAYTGPTNNPNVGRTIKFIGNSYNDSYSFQNALRSGALNIQKVNTEDWQAGDVEKNYHYTDEVWQSLPGVSDDLYTEDDAEAQSVYETEMAKIQTQDKMYDTELKQVETQQKAAETEIEGVQSLIKKNVEKSFKIFGQG